MSFLQHRSAQVDKLNGDRVLPLRLLDSNEAFTRLAVDFTLRFDDVLDPEKLHNSIKRLVQLGTWNQLGVRYKKNSKGKLELCIPSRYDDDHPGVAWSHDNRQQSITKNDLASRLPRLDNVLRPTIYEDSGVFETLVTRPGRPTKIAEWTKADHPALSVHVVSFTDATLVTLSWGHVFFDALGQQSFLQAWQAVLEGRDEDVPTFIPYEEDPLVAIAEGADARNHVLFRSALAGIWFVLFVVRIIYGIVVHSKEAGRMVRFPGPWVDALRAQAMADLRAKSVTEKDAFISHGDVLLAFWCKKTLAAQHLRPSKPVQIVNAMNLRGIWEELPVPGKTAYIGNAVMTSVTLTTVAEVESLSVGELAGRVREDLKKQRSPEQIKSMLAWSLNNLKKGALPPMVGSWKQIAFAWSNWTRARVYDVDFSSAVVHSETGIRDRTTKLGHPSFVMNHSHSDGVNIRNGGMLLGKDSNGDWWLSWDMGVDAWAEIEEAFGEA